MPASRPAPAKRASSKKGLTPRVFCKEFTSYTVSCLQKEVKKKARTAARRRRQQYIKRFLVKMMKQPASYIKRCVGGFKRQQTLRMLQKRPTISPVQLGRCLACIKKSNCSTQKQRLCRSVCMR